MLNNMIKRILFFTFTLVFLSISFSCVSLRELIFADKNEIIADKIGEWKTFREFYWDKYFCKLCLSIFAFGCNVIALYALFCNK